jgi:hypothetical protein
MFVGSLQEVCWEVVLGWFWTFVERFTNDDNGCLTFEILRFDKCMLFTRMLEDDCPYRRMFVGSNSTRAKARKIKLKSYPVRRKI